MTLLECWDSNLRNQHCFGGEGAFDLMAMVRNADYEEMA